jgi:hypothetical protein
LKRADILPANLGAAFVRKRLGLPLFGPYRPRSVPARRERCSGTRRRRPTARAAGGGPSGGLGGGALPAAGLELDADAAWLHCLVAPNGERPRLVPAAAFAAKPPTVFAHDRFTVYLARQARGCA